MKKLNVLIAIVISAFNINVFAVEAERRIIPSIDSVKLDAFVYIPKEAPKAVVLAIGGSGFSNGGYAGPSRFAKVFSDNGFLTIEWNKRGIVTNEALNDITKTFDIYNTATIDKILADAQSVLNYTKAQYPNLPIFVLGGSEGTITATLLAEQNQKTVTAVATFGNVVMPFIQLTTMQITDVFVKPNWAEMDADRNGSVDAQELKNFKNGDPEFAFISQANFAKLDVSRNNALSYDEISKFVVNSLIMNPPTRNFWYTSSGLAEFYLYSMFQVPPLTSRAANLKIPVFIAQGEDDEKTPVKPVYELQNHCEVLGLNNFKFKYYAGVGHAPSPEMATDFMEFFGSFALNRMK